MIDFSKIRECSMKMQPFRWAEISDLYSKADCAALSKTYPHDHFRTVEAYGGEKDYRYDARSLIPMGEQTISHAESLSPYWYQLAQDLLSAEYRIAMSSITGIDLTSLPMEAHVYHYGPGALLGPHRDLPEKIVTHVFYFNDKWHPMDGGCLAILNSSDAKDVAALVNPTIGNSATFVRSDTSWHEVTRVSEQATQSRRSVTVTFYQPGSISSMWPPGVDMELHDYPS
ncbi:Rps23 Pro-64 3,4-dihydroxylase Tpa1-like proline 4-hydroxylase [Acidovorax delafieldii]|uniref:Rps23 Pro-64 3,4-dihydroxylase Tpa1-like proline 4-hydroxylase n=1 Tax=Acidovorax delafieldii TaxID=47920 RepID=A0A561XY17_ACIDE|nr:2OG-Fe(II) oxygenase [Acidovorax delafieldii]TWG40997.1 Rps23 Pro-64 3,4-dihydroxylase Tpa1-like proline 4-hydroxylase [Acidovorax delafieldii]